MNLVLENVRCFDGRHSAPLAALTILVGENSSGKSTFLAMARAAWDAALASSIYDFNEPPFRLGSFNDIATLAPTGRAKFFSVGYEFEPRTRDKRRIDPGPTPYAFVTAKFLPRAAQPIIGEWKLTSGEYTITLQGGSEESKPVQCVIKAPAASATMELPGTTPSLVFFRHFWSILPGALTGRFAGPFAFRNKAGTFTKKDEEYLERLTAALEGIFSGSKPYAGAPIRTRPERTYDPITDKPTPEGDHIPMVLAKRQATELYDAEWQRTMLAITEFGGASGLFQAIAVHRLGGPEAQSDASLPFQLRVRMDRDLHFNMVDVGYGVSQVLPVLVDALSHPNRPLLLQQPEVHLHPRAQAQLGTFLGSLASQHRTSPMIVETHSDFLLDRIRMDIRDQRGVSHTDVLILYFERVGTSARIHPIRLDRFGNLIDAPEGYRSFFMGEERRFLQG